MDASLRHTPGLVARIEKLRDDLIKHFETLVARASIDRTDRSATAITQYQMQVETSALIRAAEDLQVLIRQLQEMWLFGQLNTVGESKVQQQTDGNAKVVADLLKQLLESQQLPAANGTNGTNGTKGTNGHVAEVAESAAVNGAS